LPLLEVRELTTYFYGLRGSIKAVDGIDFSVEQGMALGLVGESGCGKSITCLSILRLVPEPGRIASGEILFKGEDLIKKSEKEMRRIRGKHISMILQDPMSSLNPAYTIGEQIAEAIRSHQGLKGRSLWGKVLEILRLVRIPSAESRMYDYPHMFSGGMRQRVAGAIAMSCEPGLLIADEPTTSLDVTTQAIYLRLLKDIQKKSGLAMIFITHDFGIVAKMCDQVAVMYAGKIIENAPVREIFNNPRHPYTRALMDSVPKLEKRVTRLFNIPGQPPSLYGLPAGCAFKPRCPSVDGKCSSDEFPPVGEVGKGHGVRCWKYA
jgi:oligopeptide/dipeptide ABC transporter ATP-binding protein